MHLAGIDLLAKGPVADGDRFVGGQWLPPADAVTYPVYDPATGDRIRDVYSAGARDAHAAVQVAVRAAGAWRATPARRRSEILHGTFQLMREHSDASPGSSCWRTARP